ncbi:MAG: glycosyltransferase family 2 protein [Pedobacter sp.]|nr:glycosyltransferase family 2 protein [Pedobacter sp.]
MSIAPVVLFVYNRLDHTRQTIQALQKNILAEESDLYIYADGAKNVAAEVPVNVLREYLKTINGFKSVTIRLRKNNIGLNENIISGVTEVINACGKAIVLEDDLVTSKWFLRYMNDALDLYIDQQQVACIHGYLPPVKQKLKEAFFLKGADCWGWGTWKRAWDLFEPDGSILLSKIEKGELQDEFDFGGTYPYTQALSVLGADGAACWDIRWYASAFLENKLTLYPGTSLVNNIGHDNSGTNCADTQSYEVVLAENQLNVEVVILHDELAYNAFADFFRTLPDLQLHRKSWISKSFKYIKSLVVNQ